MNTFLIYFGIGLIVSLVNNYLWILIHKKHKLIEEDPGWLIVIFGWLIAWPIGLISTVRIIKELLK